VSDVTRADICTIACAEAWRGDGEVMASPFGSVPALGARLAKSTFAPDLVLTDGEAALVHGIPTLATKPAELVRESYVPYKTIFAIVWSGRRHIMMMASQVDQFGNQNIAAIGDFAKPKAELLGMRGAPGNTVNHATSYWVPKHGPRALVAKVDVVSGLGFDRARALGPAGRFHRLRRVITNLCVLDFETPDGAMQLRSVHPGVSVADGVAATGFELVIPGDLEETRIPTADELRLLREVIDPRSLGQKELS
jgi:acyl CoA:acetate/3-ketoacid CoA transferase beta subunit